MAEMSEIDKKIKEDVEFFRDKYFTYDEPVPFKGLTLYPVTVKDYNEFLSFYGKKAESSTLEEDSSNGNSVTVEKTPEERIEEAMAELNNALASELMDRIKTAGSEFFEKIVVRLIAKMGYGDGQQTPYSHDGGIDGIINQDKLGLDAIYLQAKMWEGNVGKPQLQNFLL